MDKFSLEILILSLVLFKIGLILTDDILFGFNINIQDNDQQTNNNNSCRSYRIYGENCDDEANRCQPSYGLICQDNVCTCSSNSCWKINQCINFNVNGLTNYWNFNNNTINQITRYDVVKSVNTAFVANRFGNPLSALYLNSGYLLLKPGVYVYGDFTVTAWVKLISYKTYQRLIDFSNGIDQNMFVITLSIDNQQTKLDACLGDNSGHTDFVSNQIIPLGKWTHVAASITNTVVTTYINGYSQGSVDFRRSVANVNRLIPYIGRSIYTDSNPNQDQNADAYIDDLKIFNRGLSNEEVISDMINVC